jgi:hypothetical protein
MPRYRIKTAIAYVGGAPWPLGAEVDFRGWPNERELSPLDDAAKRIFRYWKARRSDPGFPRSPVDAKSGLIYLPSHLPTIQGTWLPAASDRDDLPDAPRYIVNSGHKFGGRVYEQGAEIVYLAWPVKWSMKPNNAAARAVVDYMEAHGETELPPAPFNEFDDALWLPNEPTRSAQYATPPTLPYRRNATQTRTNFNPLAAR